MFEEFHKIVYELHQKTGLRNLVLEKKLETIQESLETKDVTIAMEVFEILNNVDNLEDTFQEKTDRLECQVDILEKQQIVRGCQKG